jgi:hypothetical protein
MKTVIIKPNLTFNPGNARMVLTQIGAGTITETPDGNLEAQLTDEQIRLFRLKGPMHQLTVVEPPAPPDPSVAVVGGFQSVLAGWKAATGCATPEEFATTFNDLRGDWAKAQADLNATVSDWQRVTGVSSPALFAEEFEAKPKGK